MDLAVDRELSFQLAQMVSAKAQEPWYNAFYAMALAAAEDLLYVEGWAVLPDGNAPLEHAWLESHTHIIDPTCWARRVTYFRGVCLDWEQLNDELLARSDLPIIWRSTVDPDRAAGYQQARDRAQSFLRDRVAGMSKDI